MLTPTWDISEETEQSEEASKARPRSPDYQLPVDSETSLLSRQDAESSDSGTSMSAGDKLDVSLSPKTTLNPIDTSSGQPGARPEGGDGQSLAAAAACCRASDEEGQPELDMTVQSGGPVLTEAPTLPPRTYKAPPPLPPRINKTSAPPLPPKLCATITLSV